MALLASNGCGNVLKRHSPCLSTIINHESSNKTSQIRDCRTDHNILWERLNPKYLMYSKKRAAPRQPIP